MLLLFHIVQGYAALGAVGAAAFLLAGLDRTMPSARGAYAFRPLLLPGLILLWPLVLWRWVALARGNTDPPPGRHYRATHRLVWTAFAVLLPATLIAVLALRQDAGRDPAPVQLSAPAP